MQVPIEDIIKSMNIRFRLDQPNFEFDRVKFLEALDTQLNVFLTVKAMGRSHLSQPYLFEDFKESINEIKKIYDALSLLRQVTHGGKLTLALWNIFFLRYVVPLRTELFPEIQKKIQEYHDSKPRKTLGNGSTITNG